MDGGRSRNQRWRLGTCRVASVNAADWTACPPPPTCSPPPRSLAILDSIRTDERDYQTKRNDTASDAWWRTYTIATSRSIWRVAEEIRAGWWSRSTLGGQRLHGLVDCTRPGATGRDVKRPSHDYTRRDKTIRRSASHRVWSRRAEPHGIGFMPTTMSARRPGGQPASSAPLIISSEPLESNRRDKLTVCGCSDWLPDRRH